MYVIVFILRIYSSACVYSETFSLAPVYKPREKEKRCRAAEEVSVHCLRVCRVSVITSQKQLFRVAHNHVGLLRSSRRLEAPDLFLRPCMHSFLVSACCGRVWQARGPRVSSSISNSPPFLPGGRGFSHAVRCTLVTRLGVRPRPQIVSGVPYQGGDSPTVRST
jgi:hypothetical protein